MNNKKYIVSIIILSLILIFLVILLTLLIMENNEQNNIFGNVDDYNKLITIDNIEKNVLIDNVLYTKIHLSINNLKDIASSSNNELYQLVDKKNNVISTCSYLLNDIDDVLPVDARENSSISGYIYCPNDSNRLKLKVSVINDVYFDGNGNGRAIEDYYYIDLD